MSGWKTLPLFVCWISPRPQPWITDSHPNFSISVSSTLPPTRIFILGSDTLISLILAIILFDNLSDVGGCSGEEEHLLIWSFVIRESVCTRKCRRGCWEMSFFYECFLGVFYKRFKFLLLLGFRQSIAKDVSVFRTVVRFTWSLYLANALCWRVVRLLRLVLSASYELKHSCAELPEII